MATEIGLGDATFYYLFDVKDSSAIQARLFKTLEKIGGKQQAEVKVCGGNKKPLPELMCRWMDGRFDAQAEKKGILDALCNLKKSGFFKNNREYRFIKNTIKIMFFEPHRINKHRKPIEGIVKIARRIKCEGEHRQLLLSNMDKLSFEALLTSSVGKELLQIIPRENMVVSAYVGYNKPHKNIFEYTLNYYGLDPKECIFLDDQLENVEGARAVGIEALQVKDDNHKEIKRLLKKHGFIKRK